MLDNVKRAWRKTPHVIRKPTIFIVGWAVVAAGIMMLVLPGPGWAAIFVGFAILATEFASAKRVHGWLVERLKRIISWGKQRWERLTKKPKH